MCCLTVEPLVHLLPLYLDDADLWCLLWTCREMRQCIFPHRGRVYISDARTTRIGEATDVRMDLSTDTSFLQSVKCTKVTRLMLRTRGSLSHALSWILETFPLLQEVHLDMLETPAISSPTIHLHPFWSQTMCHVINIPRWRPPQSQLLIVSQTLAARQRSLTYLFLGTYRDKVDVSHLVVGGHLHMHWPFAPPDELASAQSMLLRRGVKALSVETIVNRHPLVIFPLMRLYHVTVKSLQSLAEHCLRRGCRDLTLVHCSSLDAFSKTFMTVCRVLPLKHVVMPRHICDLLDMAESRGARLRIVLPHYTAECFVPCRDRYDYRFMHIEKGRVVLWSRQPHSTSRIPVRVSPLPRRVSLRRLLVRVSNVT